MFEMNVFTFSSVVGSIAKRERYQRTNEFYFYFLFFYRVSTYTIRKTPNQFLGHLINFWCKRELNSKAVFRIIYIG